MSSEYRPAKFKHYKPRRWQPEFDLIILDSINGLSNAELGIKYGYTKEHISNILSTEEASKVKERVRISIDKEFEGGIKDRFSRIGQKVVEHIETYIEDENNLAEKRPFEFIDRAMKIGAAVGVINDSDARRKDTAGINVEKAIFLTKEQAIGIKEGLFLSQSIDNIVPEKEPEKAVFTVHKLSADK